MARRLDIDGKAFTVKKRAEFFAIDARTFKNDGAIVGRECRGFEAADALRKPLFGVEKRFSEKRRSFGARSAETVKSNLETSIPTYIIRDRKSSQSAFPLAGQPDPFFFIFREGATGRTAFFFQVLP